MRLRILLLVGCLAGAPLLVLGGVGGATNVTGGSVCFSNSVLAMHVPRANTVIITDTNTGGLSLPFYRVVEPE